MGTVVDRLASVLGDHHDVLDAGTSAARKYAPGSILNATPGRRAKQGSGAVIARADQRTGKRRIRTRSSVKTTIAPTSISAAISARWAISVPAWCCARRSVCRKRIRLGSAAPDRASNSPKSVSAETKVLPEWRAVSSTSSSTCPRSPRSRTCTTSWPSSLRSAARRSLRHSSRRNLTLGRGGEADARKWRKRQMPAQRERHQR